MKITIFLSTLILGATIASAQSFAPLTTPNDHDYCEGTQTCTTPGVNTTGVGLAVVTCNNENIVGCSVSSSFSASWVKGEEIIDTGTAGRNISMWYALSPSASASATVTCSITPSSPTDCDVHYFSLSSGVPAFDTGVVANSSGSVSSISPGTLSLSATSDLVVTAWASRNLLNTMLINSPFLLAFEPTSATGHDHIAIAYSAATDDAPHNMTSNTSPSPFVASASTQQNPAYLAFDGVYDSSSWLGNNNGVDWLCIDLGSAKTVNVYGITNTQDTPSRSPASWTFSGSNTSCSTGLTTLDSESGVTWSDGAGASGPNYVLSFPISNTTAYRYYRIDTSSNNGGNPYTGWSEEYLYTLGTLGSTSITPTWSICSGAGCGSAQVMVSAALAFKVSTATARHRAYVINH